MKLYNPHPQNKDENEYIAILVFFPEKKKRRGFFLTLRNNSHIFLDMVENTQWIVRGPLSIGLMTSSFC
jgi:hypothetical protein